MQLHNLHHPDNWYSFSARKCKTLELLTSFNVVSVLRIVSLKNDATLNEINTVLIVRFKSRKAYVRLNQEWFLSHFLGY